MARVYGTKSTTGSGTAIIAAPPSGKEIVIFYRIVQALAATPTTISLKGGTTVLEAIRCAGDAQGLVGVIPGGAAIHCGDGQAFYIDQDAACAIHWTICYEIVDYVAP